MNDLSSSDFFRDPALLVEPYAYFDAVREQCPVWRERHHRVVLVTGYDEALEVYHDTETFSSCISVTGPFPGFPVPLDGDDVMQLIEEHRHELPMSDQLPTLDPPVHTDHRALLTDDGYAAVPSPEVPADLEEAVRSAARQCPERAITAS